MEIIPFAPEHVTTLNLQAMQAWLGDQLTVEYGAGLQAGGPAYTAVADGVVVCCAGVLTMWPQRGLAWALVGADAGRHFVRIVRAMRRMLDGYACRRIETAVVVGFDEGQRLVEMLGFVHEGRMAAYLPNGADCELYARVKHG